MLTRRCSPLLGDGAVHIGAAIKQPATIEKIEPAGIQDREPLGFRPFRLHPNICTLMWVNTRPVGVFSQELDRLADMETDILYDTGP
jgi:hypothetical protein